jgi:formyl-CoA transferase
LLNANKKSVVIDLKSPENLEALRRLIADADVFVENFFPGAIDRMGLGYEELRALNPRLVYAQLSGYPSKTRTAHYPSFDMVGQASGGLMAVTGYEGGPPHRVGAHAADSGAGLHLAVGIVAALNQRLVTGRGQQIEVSMKESSMNFARGAFGRHAAGGAPPARLGNRALVGDAAPAGMFACLGGGPDDYCYIDATGSEEIWAQLARVVSRPDLITDPRFASADARNANRDQLHALIEAWTVTRTKTEVMNQVTRLGVPASAVRSVSELISEPEYWEQGALTHFHITPEAELPMLNIPIRMSNVPTPSYWLAEAGAHNNWFETTVGHEIGSDSAGSTSAPGQPSTRFASA